MALLKCDDNPHGSPTGRSCSHVQYGTWERMRSLCCCVAGFSAVRMGASAVANSMTFRRIEAKGALGSTAFCVCTGISCAQCCVYDLARQTCTCQSVCEQCRPLRSACTWTSLPQSAGSESSITPHRYANPLQTRTLKSYVSGAPGKAEDEAAAERRTPEEAAADKAAVDSAAQGLAGETAVWCVAQPGSRALVPCYLMEPIAAALSPGSSASSAAQLGA